MMLSTVENMDAVASAVEEAVTANEAVSNKTRGFHAVDISFRNTEGIEIEPLKPIRVSIKSESIKRAVEDTSTAPVVVHVTDNVTDQTSADTTDASDENNLNDSGEKNTESNPETVEDSETSETGVGTDENKDNESPIATIVETEKQITTENSVKNDFDTLTFEAGAFSVYAIVYTVDFEYEVDGKMYQFSLPGGGFVSFTDLVEVLGIIGDTNSEENEAKIEEQITNGMLDVTASDTSKKFVEDVESVIFSNPELVQVEKVDTETTVGELKEAIGLDCEYSTELTEEQIEGINSTVVQSGDWALISVQPFESEETLTVTMKDGEVFTIRVTDAQITTLFPSDSGDLFEVNVKYGEAANIPKGSTLRVTEFSEDDEEYQYARNSVLADKKARGEWIDLSSFGLAALDISILNPDGKEIEPEAPVQVEIRIKELPGVEDLSEVADTLAIQHHVEVEDGVVVETVFDGNADASFKLETNETVAAEGIVVDPDSVSEEDFANSDLEDADGIDLKFDAAAFSTFTISWNNANGNGVKVHYVDENGNELPVKNSTFLSSLTSSSTTPAYLIYDIDGYEYDYTYRRYYSSNRWNKQNIVPQLQRNKNGWRYSTNGSYWSDLSASNATRKDEIYVVYKKKADVVPGGTPTVKQNGSVDPPVAPRINKESTPNGDDTNTLALSLISDTAKLEVEKLADVIVVFDVSGSMNDNDMGNNTTRLQAAKKAVNDLAAQLAQKKNSNGDPLVRMSLIKFSTKADPVMGLTELTTSGNNSGLNQIKTAVNNLSADGGTNWDHALQLANEENDLDSGRGTFVIFVTDGDPTFRNTRMDVTDKALQGETNNRSGNPNPYYLNNTVYGPGDNDKTGKCYDAAVIQGNAIVSAGKTIYTIGISNDVTKVQTFNTDIHGNGAYLAADSSALNRAFADIEASISGASGWGNIKMTDGITNLSNTVQKTGLTNVGGDFSYWTAPAPSNWDSMTEAQKNAYKPPANAFVPWDPQSAGAAPAVYNGQTGAVEWNMGNTFMPEAGVTYQVRFKVWPSQEAYDYIAKLNNGTIQYDNLPANVRAQIIKNGSTYTLKTNEPNANTTYQPAIKTGDKVTVSGDTKTLLFPSVTDLNLSVDKMKVKKEWVNSLDPDARWKTPVTLLLTDGAGNLYKSIALNEGNEYTAEDNFISCGLAKVENNELVIYEQGHDFKLSEPEEYAYYWNLDSQIYRPMIIDAQLTMLVKVDAPSEMGDKTYYAHQGTKYYKIGNGTYKAISTGDAAAEITATNIRRSNLNLTKKVVDEKGNPVTTSELFAFTITINDSQDKKVWFSVQTDANDTSTIVKNLSTDAVPEVKDGEKTGYYYADSGSEIAVSIQPGWNLRFTNLPNGTTYTITENAKENYSFVNASIDNNGTFSTGDGTTVGTGTINESDKQYTVTYTNRAVTQQVFIQKTGQDAQTPLQGAVFSLYTKAGYEADPQKVLKTELESDEDGKIDLGRLVAGEYYLVETSAPDGYILLTDPVEITVNADKVQYKQISNSLSTSNGGVSGGREEGYTLVVTNNAGYELPSTGGPGTRLFTIFGSILILGAGVLLWRKRRLI